MHIETTKNPKSTCHLLRQSYWEDGKPKKRTLANLSTLPDHAIEAVRRALRAGRVIDTIPLAIRSSRAHGAVSAILGTIRSCELDRIIFHRADPRRSRVLAMIIARLLRPGAKLRIERELGPAGATTLAGLLDIRDTDVDELYAAMDWLHARQSRIERKLARVHVSFVRNRFNPCLGLPWRQESCIFDMQG